MTLGSTSDNTKIPNVTWRSRRSRKARYSPVTHIIASENQHKCSAADQFNSGSADEAEKIVVALRIQTESHLKPHLILDVTFWLAVTFTFGSALWVVNGQFGTSLKESVLR
jgi:hypothetical protein